MLESMLHVLQYLTGKIRRITAASEIIRYQSERLPAQAQRREALEEAARLKDQLAEANDAAAAAQKKTAAVEAALEDSRHHAEDSAAAVKERAAELEAASERARNLEDELVRLHLDQALSPSPGLGAASQLIHDHSSSVHSLRRGLHRLSGARVNLCVVCIHMS